MSYQPPNTPHNDPLNGELIDTLWLRMVEAAKDGKPSDAKACLDLIERIEARIQAAKRATDIAKERDRTSLIREFEDRFIALALENRGAGEGVEPANEN